MKIAEDAIVQRHPQLKMRKYLKGTIIEPGLALNEVATYILDRIDGQRTIADICHELVKNYDIDYEKCLQDTIELIEQMLAQDLLQTCPSTP